MSTKQELIKPYFVKAEEVTSAMIEATFEIMKRESFTYSQLCGGLYRAGLSWDNHERGGDRLVQRARKMGLIRYAKGTWRTIPEAWETLS
jgi:hypothetical protein